MELYDMVTRMSNHSYEVQVWDSDESEELFKGEVYELEQSDFFSEYQFAEVVDIYATGNNTMIICIDTDGFNDEDEDEE